MKCEFCRIWRDSEFEGAEEAGLQPVINNLSSLKKMGIRTINFTGGEPLQRDDITDILAGARRSGFYIRLFTGGAVFPRMAKELKGLIDDLYISLDAPIEDIHNRIRGRECFFQVFESISGAKRNGIRPVLNFTLTRESVRYLPEMEDISRQNGVVLRINPVHHFFGLEGLEKMSVEYLKRYAGRKTIDLSRATLELLRRGGNEKAKPVCKALSTVITISPDDHLILPCINTMHARVPIRGELEKVWSSEIVLGYRQLEGRLDKCAGCCDLDYILPSFGKKFNRCRLLNMLSGCCRGSAR
jgi:MoaA/NifB/PqqE/SkfB family radical SAM enzyme